MKKLGRPLLTDANKWIVQLRNEGKTYREISKITGRGLKTVWSVYHRDKGITFLDSVGKM